MRVTPLAVWSSTLEKDDVYLAIKADVEFTHSNLLVQNAVFIYSMAIHCLLNKADKENRAEIAFIIALELSKSSKGNYVSPSTNESCLRWLKIA